MPRRDSLLAFAGLAYGASLLDDAAAAAPPAAPARAAYTPPGLQRDLPPEAGTLPPAVIAARLPFDLQTAAGRRLARLKTIGNLVGRRNYMAFFTRHIWCAPGQPAVPLLNEIELMTTFLERSAAGVDAAVLQRIIVTRVPLDARTLTPVASVVLPGGPRIALVDTLFAMTLPLDLGDDAKPDAVLQHDQPHFAFGADTAFTMFDPRAGAGSHQPRVDMSIWRAKTAELMDPARDPIRAEYGFSAIMRANVFGWTELKDDDATQVLRQKIGFKTHALDELPDSVKRYILDVYPNRA
jgi:hypothetical protein